MKIRKLLKNLDAYAYIKILEYVGLEDWEVLWKGEVYNCPWEIAEGIVDTDDIGEGIFLDTIEDGSPCLCIYRKECD